jgi:DNA-dependent RNA polymerase auxiliary subunit epsilon
MNARSMSGITASGAGGDVFQNGDNVFTGTNTYNTNLPTSSVTPTSGSQLITKTFADATYATGGGTGDVTLAGNPNAFTGTNTFNNNRPTSTLTNTPAANEFITKRDAENEFAILGAGTAGSPQEFFGFTNFEENVGINGQNLNLTNGINRVIDMATSPPTTSNKLLMEAPTTEITMTSGTTKNEFSQVATSTAINVISQVGANSTITTEGKMTCATAPTAGSDLCNKTYVDGFASLSAGDITTPQDFTGINEFSGGNLLMTKEDIQNFQMIQTDETTSVVNSFTMTGLNNRIQQTGTTNGNLNEFKQSGGSAMSSTISQYTTSALIYQDSTTATFITKGRIGIGKNATAVPIAPLEIQGGATSLNNGTNYGYLRNNASPAAYSAGWGAFALSIYASTIIFAANYVLASDERIKRDITDLSSTLVLIDKIKPKTYKYRDTAQGDRITYGFIAQELEQVLPEAILTTREKIPNIMKTANVIDGVFTLEEATDLIEGDDIAIYDEDNKQYSVKVTELISDKSFKIDMIEDLQDQFFIYGKFVDDFKAIEHNDLLPVMIKGIQELNAKNKALEDRLAILEDKIKNM